ncbi:hypothetical protein FQR65_LT03781 [Abscondita terminalis]|nr:hypothetical protein FQR65_LT03781 [Abscondita terminalis]
MLTTVFLDLLPIATSIASQYRGPIKAMLGFYPRLVLCDAKSVEFVLSSKTILKKSSEYKFLSSWLGSGLLTSDGTKWKKHRRLLTPAFHFQILERFIDVFVKQSNILISKLEKIEHQEVDIFPYARLHALDVICEATMNTSINAQTNPTSNYVESVKEMCRILMERALSFKMWDILYMFTTDYQKEQKALNYLHGLSNSVIKTRREEFQTQSLTNMTIENDSGTKKRVAFLDILLTSSVDEVPLTHEEIRNEVDTFMFADKVFEEIIEILGKDDSASLSYENLQQMKYMEQFIKEVLRMYPPVPIFSRVLTEDVTYDEKKIPKGVQFLIFSYQLHRNRELFPNPEVFDPERFNAENSKNMSLYSYVPFSAGSRNCIGQRFAMLEIKATVCKVLQKFKLLPVIGHEPVLLAETILSSENGLPVRLQKRRLIPSASNIMSQYNGPVKLMVGFYPALLMADAKSVEFVLSSKTILHKSPEYKFLNAWLGTGLLTSAGMKWRKHRKLLTPAFHFQILERFIDVFDKQSTILIEKLDKVKDNEVNIFSYARLHALDVICEATMNTPINAQYDPTSNYVKSVREMCRIVMGRAISIKRWNFVYKFSKDYFKEQNALRILHGLSNSVIKTRRKELETRLSDCKDDLETKKRIAFLDILLTSTFDGVALTNTEIRNEVDTFMFAGHDTTTSALSFSLYCLSKYENLQEKVYKEITEILGKDNIELSYEKLQKMKYMEQFIKEVLRMYSPVPAFSRILTEDALYDGKIIPKRVRLIVFAYRLHHNPDLFPNPNVFDPERFNPENSKNMSLYSYVPFSAGSRNCIGQRFAMLGLKATVSKVLQKFKLLPVFGHEPILMGDAILSSENGLPIRLEIRK